MSAPDLWRKTARALLPDATGVPDTDLLARFRDARDEAAFELLLYRHGPMVWATCRRHLRDRHAAEDAFQATFLALACRAGSIRRTQSVPAWLHRVAVRAGLYVLRRRPTNTPLNADAMDPHPGPSDRATAADAAAHIDAAVNRLPERLRRVVVLCELHGHSLQEAAARLRCPVGTVASRLARARERLRKMLSARGLTAGVVGGLITAELVPAEVRATALRTIVGQVRVPPALATLARHAGGPAWGGTAYAVACSLVAGLVAVAIGLEGSDHPQPGPKRPPKEALPAAAVRTDAEGVPLPDGAVARLGSSRFRFDGGWDPIVFSPDGSRVAAAGRSGVTVFDAATGRVVHRLPVGEGPGDVQVIRFLSDGKGLAVGSRGRPVGALTVFGLADGKVLSSVKFPGKNEVYVIDVTRDGSRALLVDWFVRAYLWDVAVNREVWAINHEQGTDVSPFTADGKRFVVSAFRKAELHDAATGRVVATFPDPGPGFGRLSSPVLSPDGRLAVGADQGNAVAVLAAEGATRVRTLPSDRRTERLFFSPDARYLVGPTWLGTQVWDLKAADDKGPVAHLPRGTGAGFAPDGKTLALAGEGCLTLWSVGDWKQLPQSADPPSPVRRVLFTPDGRWVLGHTGGGWVQWLAAGGPARRVSDDSPVYPQGLGGLSADGRFALDVLCAPGKSPDKDKYALRVTEVATGTDRRIAVADTPWDPVQISPDGRHVSALVAGSEFVVWDARTGAVLHRQKWPQESFLYGAAPAPDGKGLARSLVALSLPGVRGPVPGGASRYRSVTVTDHATGRTWDPDLMPSSIYIGGGRFSRDGTRLVLLAQFVNWRGGDGVTVWDAPTGRRLMDRKWGGGPVAAAADHRSLLVADLKGNVALVEVATGGDRAAFRHQGWVTSAALSRDGTKAVASSPDAPVYVWDLLGDPGKMDPAKADAVWADLASPDAKASYAVIRKLRANPAEAVAFLRDRVRPPAVPAAEAVAGWLKQLNAPAFADRERAQKELSAVADLVRHRLEAARKAATSEEVARRLDQVLKSIDEMTPERLRAVRACEVLEGLATPDAVHLLRAWAAAPPGARVTTEAKESLDRLKP